MFIRFWGPYRCENAIGIGSEIRDTMIFLGYVEHGTEHPGRTPFQLLWSLMVLRVLFLTAE